MDVEYSREDIDAFRELVELGESHVQTDRISSRMDMPKFIEEHGRAKCDAMFKVLEKEI